MRPTYLMEACLVVEALGAGINVISSFSQLWSTVIWICASSFTTDLSCYSNNFNSWIMDLD